jgi:hypothetical protein
MSAVWFRSRSLRISFTACAVMCVSIGPQAALAQRACDAAAEAAIGTCAEPLSSIHQTFLQQRKQRAMSRQPEDEQIAGRLSGRAWDANANGDFPVFLAPAGTAIEMRTSLSKWGAYFASEELEKFEKVEDGLAQGVSLPRPAQPRNTKLDVWSSTKLNGLLPGDPIGGLASQLGADYAISKDFLVGASVEFEDLEQDAATGIAGGKGYMVGPYLARRLTNELVFNAQVAWGESEDVVDSREAASRFSTQRRLARAQLEGDVDLAGWQVSSLAAFTYAAEIPEDGTEQGVTTNEITLGPALRRGFHIEDGPVIEPFLRYHNTAELDLSQSLAELESLRFKGTLGGGVSVTMPDEYQLQATTEIRNGDTQTDPEVSGRVQVTIPIP